MQSSCQATSRWSQVAHPSPVKKCAGSDSIPKLFRVWESDVPISGQCVCAHRECLKTYDSAAASLFFDLREGFASWRFLSPDSGVTSSVVCAASTHSINAIAAASLFLSPSFTILVYPPFRSALRGAMSSNNFFTASFCRKTASAVRRACSEFLFPSVTIFSASGRTAFALASVVLIR
jgi:hypothetical protein